MLFLDLSRTARIIKYQLKSSGKYLFIALQMDFHALSLRFNGILLINKYAFYYIANYLN